jgi:aerobic-type carbon monoxide dehydrogenase small subunit (CoxS/CutS family)
MDPTTINLNVNGQKRAVTTDPRRPLLDVLREDFQLTGTKYGCGEGQCGACTVLVDGQRTFSCQAAVGDAADKAVLTVEGLPKGDVLHPVQEAFLAEGAFQCGYCTSGMIMATVCLLDAKPSPTDRDIVSWMDKNLCRCCGYPKLIKAVRRAADAGNAKNANHANQAGR